MNIFKKFANMIRWGRITNIDSDTKQFPQNQYEYFDKVKDMVAVYPYGHHAKAPLNTLCLLVNVGHEENSCAIELSEDIRPKGLKEGEAVFGNFVIGSIIKFHQDRKIEIIAKNDIDVNCEGDVNVTATGDVNVTATNVVLNADTEINGDLTVNGDIGATGTITGGAVDTTGGIDLDTHVHYKEATPPVVGQTGEPV